MAWEAYSRMTVGQLPFKITWFSRCRCLARQGIEVEREARDITVYSINIIDISLPEFTIEVACSKGTYVRTLCHDIGQKLQCGAVLTELRRIMAAGFGIDECITLEEAQKLTSEDKLIEKLIPIDRVFSYLPKIVLSEKDTVHYLNGVRMTAKRFRVNSSDGDIAVYDENNRLLGISYVNEKGFLTTKKQFVIIGG